MITLFTYKGGAVFKLIKSNDWPDQEGLKCWYCGLPERMCMGHY